MNRALNNVKNIISAVFVLSLAVLFSGCSESEDESALYKAFSLIETQEYEDALSEFENAREEKADLKEIYRGEGIAYLGQGRYDEAIEAFENALSESNGILEDMDFDINYYLATAFYKKGDADEAAEIYDAIIKLRPDEADAYYLRGVILSKDGRTNEAKSDFDRVISLESENYERLIAIYTILSENGYKETGQLYLKNAMENASKKMTDFEKGRISFYLEDYESARTYLERAKDEAGDEAVLFLGKTYEVLGDNNYAVSVYNSYINSGGASAQIYNEMGLCRLKTGDYEGALSSFRSAMNIEDNDMLQTLKYNEVIALEYMGAFDEARTQLNAYIKSYPDDEKAKREYIFLKTR